MESDQNPIVVHVCNEAQAGPRSFWFHRIWGEHKDFMLLLLLLGRKSFILRPLRIKW